MFATPDKPKRWQFSLTQLLMLLAACALLFSTTRYLSVWILLLAVALAPGIVFSLIGIRVSITGQFTSKMESITLYLFGVSLICPFVALACFVVLRRAFGTL